VPRDDLNILFARACVLMCGRHVLQRPLSREGNSTSKCRPKGSGHMHFLSVQQKFLKAQLILRNLQRFSANLIKSRSGVCLSVSFPVSV